VNLHDTLDCCKTIGKVPGNRVYSEVGNSHGYDDKNISLCNKSFDLSQIVLDCVSQGG
jgi:hypothetical protein